MNQFLVQAILGVLRLLLAAGSGQALMSDEELNQAAGAIAAILLIVWSVWRKYKEHQKPAEIRTFAPRKPFKPYGKHVS